MKFIKFIIWLIIPLLIVCFNNELEVVSIHILGFNLVDFKSYNDWISICFTSGSLVFAIQSFLEPFMEQSLYSTKAYKNHLIAEYGEYWQEKQYRPLKNLSEFLFVTTTDAFISVIFMIMFIFVKKFLIISFAIYFGGVSFIGLMCALFAMRNNFNIMFNYKRS